MLTTLQGVLSLYDAERAALLRSYRQLYDKWMYEMWYVLLVYCLYLGVDTLKDVFENVASRSIIAYVKDVNFYNRI